MILGKMYSGYQQILILRYEQ